MYGGEGFKISGHLFPENSLTLAGCKPWHISWVHYSPESVIWVNRLFCWGASCLHCQSPPNITMASCFQVCCASRLCARILGQMQLAAAMFGGDQWSREEEPGRTISSICTMEGLFRMQQSPVWRLLPYPEKTIGSFPGPTRDCDSNFGAAVLPGGRET